MGLNYKIDSFDIAGFEIEYEQYRTKPLDSVCGEARVYCDLTEYLTKRTF